MDLHDELASAVPAQELRGLAEGHHARAARPLGVQEAAVPAREREAFTRQILAGVGSPVERVAAWGADTVEGDVR